MSTISIEPSLKVVSTEEGQKRACVWRVYGDRKADHQASPGERAHVCLWSSCELRRGVESPIFPMILEGCWIS